MSDFYGQSPSSRSSWDAGWRVAGVRQPCACGCGVETGLLSPDGKPGRFDCWDRAHGTGDYAGMGPQPGGEREP